MFTYRTRTGVLLISGTGSGRKKLWLKLGKGEKKIVSLHSGSAGAGKDRKEKAKQPGNFTGVWGC